MGLIKCEDCGKEISDKSKDCVYCGCSIKININSKDKNVVPKWWDELTFKERNRIRHYRKMKNENQSELKTKCNFIWFLYFVLCVLQFIFMGAEIIIMIFPCTCGCFISLIFCIYYEFAILKDEKEWYEENKEQIYNDGFLPLH